VTPWLLLLVLLLPLLLTVVPMPSLV